MWNLGLFRSAPAFMNMLIASLKIIADYYPQRLHKAFVIDPPSLFSYLWKVRYDQCSNKNSILVV